LHENLLLFLCRPAVSLGTCTKLYSRKKELLESVFWKSWSWPAKTVENHFGICISNKARSVILTGMSL